MVGAVVCCAAAVGGDIAGPSVGRPSAPTAARPAAECSSDARRLPNLSFGTSCVGTTADEAGQSLSRSIKTGQCIQRRGAGVNVFDLDRALVSDYQRFARSFPQIWAPDIRSQVENLYASSQLWPDPLISINPHFGMAPRSIDWPPTVQCTTTRHRYSGSSKATTSGFTAIRRSPRPQYQSFEVTTGTGPVNRFASSFRQLFMDKLEVAMKCVVLMLPHFRSGL
jgi:hypothetical protein